LWLSLITFDVNYYICGFYTWNNFYLPSHGFKLSCRFIPECNDVMVSSL